MKQLWFVVVREFDIQIVRAFNMNDAIVLAQARSKYTNEGTIAVCVSSTAPTLIYDSREANG